MCQKLCFTVTFLLGGLVAAVDCSFDFSSCKVHTNASFGHKRIGESYLLACWHKNQFRVAGLCSIKAKPGWQLERQKTHPYQHALPWTRQWCTSWSTFKVKLLASKIYSSLLPRERFTLRWDWVLPDWVLPWSLTAPILLISLANTIISQLPWGMCCWLGESFMQKTSLMASDLLHFKQSPLW